MKKVLVAEIGLTTLSLTAFGDLDIDRPLLLGQENTCFGLEKGLTLLEKDIGASDTEYLECTIVSSLGQGELQQVIKDLDRAEKANLEINFMGEIPQQEGMAEQWLEAKILKTHEAIGNLSSLFLEEVGEVLILVGDKGSVDLYLIQKNKPLLIGRGPETGQDNRARVSPTPKTAEELAFEREHTAQTLRETILTFCQGYPDSLTSHSTRDLTGLRWVIGTGSALTSLPGGLEVIRESLAHCTRVNFPEAGFPILIDRDNILTSLGAFSNTYREGAWQLLLESLGVDS